MSKHTEFTYCSLKMLPYLGYYQTQSPNKTVRDWITVVESWEKTCPSPLDPVAPRPRTLRFHGCPPANKKKSQSCRYSNISDIFIYFIVLDLFMKFFQTDSNAKNCNEQK